MNYYDYFPEEEHMDEDVPMDEFIAEATRTDIRFQTLAEELQFLRTARVTLNNELFTCYEEGVNFFVSLKLEVPFSWN